MAIPKAKSIDREAIYGWDDVNKIWVAQSSNADGSINVVSNGSVVNDGNSTTTPLLAGQTFTGVATDILHFNSISILVSSDVASATDGFDVEFSPDGITWYEGETYTIDAGATKFFTPPVQGRYMRVTYENGGTNQSSFIIHTILKKGPIKWSSHNLTDNLDDGDDATLGISVLKLRTAQDNYVTGAATASGNFKVSLEELESGVSSNANSQLNVTPFLSNGNEGIAAADSPSIDAFGRWRVSNPQTLFDSKNIFDDPDLASSVENQPLFFDNQETSGSGTSTTYDNDTASQTISVANTTAGVRVRQTKRRFNYQPGKSQLIFQTFVLGTSGTGIIRREGVFDEENGLFLEDNEGTYRFVRRTFTSGSAVDNAVAQTNWNIDPLDGTGPSGITLDFTKTQILATDFEWLGVGRVRMGFVIDGKFYYAHEFLNANSLAEVYMSTPNLPIRSEIRNDGTGAAASLIQICSSVISEGGSQDLGFVRAVDTNGTHVDCDVENTEYAILGVRLKQNYLGATVKLVEGAAQLQTASDQGIVRIRVNPTVAGTFTYSDVSQSAIQLATGATANTVTGGYSISSGFVQSGSAAAGASGSGVRQFNDVFALGSLIDGTSDTLVLTFQPIAGTTNADVEGSLSIRELV